jgi:uncharacterized protein YndB with AHSA1/START domain
MKKKPVLVTVSTVIEAPPRRIYDAWLIPQNASKWLFATPTGEMVRADIEPRVGGTFTLTDRRDGEDIVHTGRYLELVPGKRLMFTFKVPKYSKEETTVRVEITPQSGGCRVVLNHQGVPADQAEAAREGWTKMLEALARETKG